MTSFPEELDAWSCSGQPADCAAVLPAAQAQAGALLSFTPGGAWKVDAGVGSSDLAWAAGHPGFSREPANANPYGVFAVPGGTFVTDAGANTLDLVKADGDVSVVSAFAPPALGGFPADTVPTCVFLVDMWGTPGPPVPAGPSSAAFTGSIVELAPDGTATVLARGLNFPNGIAVARDGSLYLTVGSTCSAQGSPFPLLRRGWRDLAAAAVTLVAALRLCRQLRDDGGAERPWPPGAGGDARGHGASYGVIGAA
jgi:hypothetical protein